MKKYANYRGFKAEMKEDGTLYDSVFSKEHKSIKSFKKWCTIFGYKWFSRDLFNEPFRITNY